MDNHTKKLKEHFDSASRGAFPPPTDIRFVVYSKNIWLNFLSAVKQKNNPLVVDFGCGGGTALFCLEKEGFNNLQGVDLCPNIPANFLKCTKFREEDALNSSFEKNCVDAVVSTMFIEHIDDVKFVTEIYRVLKPGGIALVTSVLKKKWAWYFYKNENGQRVLEPSHLREYTSVNDFSDLFLKEHNFELIAIKPVQLSYPVIDPIFRFLHKLTGINALRTMPTRNFVLNKLRNFRIPILGYYSIEILVRKK